MSAAARRGARALLAALAGAAGLGATSGDLARGDAAWARRAEGAQEGVPRPGPIGEAIDAYRAALARTPDDLEARWKLLRALHFQGEFAARDPETRRAGFERAREVAEEGLDRLARRLGSGARLDGQEPEAIRSVLSDAGVPPREVARLHFWAAIGWGAWSRTAGLFDAVRSGAANRMHRYASVTKVLEPGYDEGAVYRLLGRLHAELPEVPFVTGWVERERALPLLERAVAIGPEHPGNRLLLAETLLALAPSRRGEAIELLQRVRSLEPRPSMRIEDLAIRERARRTLADVRAGAA